MLSQKRNSHDVDDFTRFMVVFWLLCFGCAAAFVAGTLIHDMRLEDFYEDFHYDSAIVKRVCEKFEINDNDDFCIDYSSQTPGTFKLMLERNFPVGETTYSTIMPYLKDIRAFSMDCGARRNDPREGYCPPPEECNSDGYPDYRCSIKFPDDLLGMQIYFEKSTGLVTKYVAIWPSPSE